MSSESPDFVYAIPAYDVHSRGNVFWSVARDRMNYTCFGDIVAFAATLSFRPRK